MATILILVSIMDKETLVLKEVTFRAMIGMMAVMVGDAVGAEVGRPEGCDNIIVGTANNVGS